MLDPTKDAAGNVISRDQPKHPFYKSKSDGSIYPAMTSPGGYEDKNPDDWEPASESEIAAERQKLADIRAARRAARAAQDSGDTATLDTSTGAVTGAAPPVVQAETTTDAAPPVVTDTVVPPAAPTSGFKLPGKAD